MNGQSERDPDQNRRELGGPGEPEALARSPRDGPASSLLKGCPAFRNFLAAVVNLFSKVINSIP